MISEILSPKRSEADRWVSVPERGTPASLGVIAWIAERVGRPLARLLLFPITIYFLITAHAARRASYEFLKRARGRSVHWWHVLRHFYYFAATILDRVYLLRGEFDRFLRHNSRERSIAAPKRKRQRLHFVRLSPGQLRSVTCARSDAARFFAEGANGHCA